MKNPALSRISCTAGPLPSWRSPLKPRSLIVSIAARLISTTIPSPDISLSLNALSHYKTLGSRTQNVRHALVLGQSLEIGEHQSSDDLKTHWQRGFWIVHQTQTNLVVFHPLPVDCNLAQHLIRHITRVGNSNNLHISDPWAVKH